MHERVMLALGFLFAIACVASESSDVTGSTSAGGDTSESGGGSVFDEDATVARALAYATTMTRVDAEPRPSQHGLAKTVNMWASDSALSDYLALDPAAPGPAPSWALDALLVKEHLDADGVVNGLTVMAQGDPDPSTGGWWWARLDADGTVHETGQVGFCIRCHTPAEPAGWAFGVPLDNRR